MPIGRTPTQPKPAIIQWDNGRGTWRAAGESRKRQEPCFHIETGRNEEFDAAMHAAGVPLITFLHPAKGGRPATVTQDWLLGTFIGFHPITAGPPADTVSSITLDATMLALAADAGIGIRWPADGKSSLALRGFLALPIVPEDQGVTLDDPDVVRALVASLAGARELGQPAPCAWHVIPVMAQFGTSSNATDDLLAALIDHRRVCEAADAFRSTRPEVVTFHELVLPLMLGAEEERRSTNPEKGGSSTTVCTFVSAHPATVTKDYVRAMWRPAAIHQSAENLFAGIQHWARRYQGQGQGPIGAPSADGDDGGDPADPPPPPPPAPRAASSGEPRGRGW